MSTFWDQANRTPLTFIILLAYVTLASVTGILEPDGEKIVAFGAARPFLIQEGEWWRLLAHAFLHGGIIHLAFNSYFLFIVGPGLEQTLGSARFALLYIVGAVGGGIGGCLWHYPLNILVGGSGALFGMLGCVLALMMRQGRHPLDFLNYAGPRQIVFLIGANLLIGLIIPVVSNAAHVGGLVAGFALTFCFIAPRREQADAASRVIQAGWIAVFASLLFYCAFPVVRWDYLDRRMHEEFSNEQGGDFARALVLDLGQDLDRIYKEEGRQLIRARARRGR